MVWRRPACSCPISLQPEPWVPAFAGMTKGKGMRSLIIAFVTACVWLSQAQAEPQWMTLPPTPALPKAVQSGLAPVNGIKIWYATFGPRGGEPVILLHGGLANSNYWGNQVRALQTRYRIVVMDSRGHGRSSRDEKPYG